MHYKRKTLGSRPKSQDLANYFLNQTKPATGLGQVCEVQVRDLRAAGIGGALWEQDARVQERTHKRKEQGWWSSPMFKTIYEKKD